MYIAIVFSVVFLIICSAYFIRVKASDGDSKSELISNGIRLIVYAGLLLIPLKLLNAEVNFTPLLDQMCQEVLSQNRFQDYTNAGCKVNDSVLNETAKSFISSALEALSWLIPFIFASVGVNVLSQGLLMPGRESEITEEKIVKKLPDWIQSRVRWFLSQLP